MFKELGALIDAAGKVAAKSLRISANAVKEALSDKDYEGDHIMGLVDPTSIEFPSRSLPGYSHKKTIKGIYDENTGTFTNVKIEDK